MKIGIVDLDTSHPAAWIPIERELGHEIAGLWDGGSVHPAGYAEAFAVEHGIPRVFASLDEMAREVDCAILHGCDWETHVEKARPFVEAGRALFIDKPVAGNRADLRQFAAWAEGGARIAGGSALRFCAELRDWLAIPVAERGVPHTAFCGCAVDEFNYGIHAYSLLSEIFGPGLLGARHLGQGAQRRIELRWPGERAGFVLAGKLEKWLPFYGTIVTERTVFQFQADAARLYRALLEAVLPYLAGETDQPPVPLDSWLDPELAALAARQSWLQGDGEVRLDALREDPGYDGPAFAVEYRQAKYG